MSANYIFLPRSATYGEKQEDYLLRSECIIQTSVEQLQIAVAKKIDLRKFFHEWIDSLAKARNEIAVAHALKNEADFGKRRDEIVGGTIYYTVLTNHRKNYNATILQRMHAQLKKLPQPLNVGIAKHTLTEKTLGRASIFTFERLDEQELAKRHWNRPLSDSELQNCFGTPENIAATSIKQKFQLFKQQFPEEYQSDQMHDYLKVITDLFPLPKQIPLLSGYSAIGSTKNLKSHWILGTSHLEIDGNQCVLSQYLTWMYFDGKSDPCDRMLSCSTVQVLHQDPFLIEDTLNDIAQIFERAMQWKREKESALQLKQLVGLLRYEFAHAKPYFRGSGSIGEWIEASLYRYHSFEIQYLIPKIDMEALSSLLLSDFMSHYDSMISLASPVKPDEIPHHKPQWLQSYVDVY